MVDSNCFEWVMARHGTAHRTALLGKNKTLLKENTFIVSCSTKIAMES